MKISMHQHGFWTRQQIAALYHTSTIEGTEAEYNQRSRILPASYSKKADLQSLVPKHIPPDNQQLLLSLLQEFSDLRENWVKCQADPTPSD